MQRNDNAATPLSRRDHTGLEFATGTRRAVRCEGHGMTRPELTNGAEQGPGSASPAGPADGAVSQGLREISQVLSFPGVADHDGNPLMAVLPE
jgi:hypothetical protein